jgi:ribosomal protein L24E
MSYSMNYVPEQRLEPLERETVIRCEYCGEAIYPGEKCYELHGDLYHEECFQDEALTILREKCGAIMVLAEEDDGYRG